LVKSLYSFYRQNALEPPFFDLLGLGILRFPLTFEPADLPTIERETNDFGDGITSTGLEWRGGDLMHSRCSDLLISIVPIRTILRDRLPKLFAELYRVRRSPTLRCGQPHHDDARELSAIQGKPCSAYTNC
jgi:hypothetical protein